MTDTAHNTKPEDTATAHHGSKSGHDMYTYVTAGISEHQGAVPLWLWIVVVSLLVWGLYYLVQYWTAPLTY